MDNVFISPNWQQLARVITAGALMGIAGAASAEGSRDLYPASYAGPGAGRANLNLSTLASNRYLDIIPSRTFLYVYAEAGEVILLGSRNRTSGGVGAIEVFNPPGGQNPADLGFGTRADETVPGTADYTCDAGTTGLIPDRAAELAGPNSADGSATVPDGFTPCAYQAPQSGVYAVLFSGGSSGGSTGSVSTPAVSASSVSAWDVTVRSSLNSLTNIDGRLFTYAFAGATGGNGDGRRLYSTLYYVTDDGYRYEQTQRGMDPNAFAMYSNPQGFLDQGEPLYKSIRSNTHYLTGGILPNGSGIVAQRPSYPIFFTNPMIATGFADTRSYLDIPENPSAPQITDISFSYPPTQGSTTYVGRGGTFSFEAQDAISYQIVISRDGVDYDPANPDNRVLNGSVVNGLNQVFWNGYDNSGNPFPAGSGFEFQATVRNGEVHFPFVDAENNLSGGPTVVKLNGPNAGDATVYYDDRGYVTRNGTSVGTLNGDICGQGFNNQPVPGFSLTGVDSSDSDLNGPDTYYRSWDGSNNSGQDCSDNSQFFGDAKALDLWTFERTEPDPGIVLDFDIIDYADVTTSLSVSQDVAPGDQATAVIQFSNVGSQEASGVVYSLELPAGLSGVTCSGATCNYDAATGTISVTGLPASLSPGQSSAVTLSWVAPDAAVEVESFISTSSDQGPNLAPDSATGTGQNNPGATNTDVLAQISAPVSATPGSTVGLTLSYLNLGPLTADDMTYVANLPTGLSGVTCPVATCSYDAATGETIITGLPASLASGESVSVALSYTAPTSGAVAVSNSVTTSTSEVTLVNNTATASTNIVNVTTADVTTSVSPPSVANAGSTVTVPVSFQNLGPQVANDVDYDLVLGPNLSSVNCSGATCVYDAATGVLTVTGLPASLANGESTSFSVSYVAPASGVVPVSSSITTSSTESNALNNAASSETRIAGVDLFVTVDSNELVTTTGNGRFELTFGNQGEAPAADVTYSADLPTGLSDVTCAGATCSYDPVTGELTLTGLPDTLDPGQEVTVEVTVPAGGVTGEFFLEASVDTSTPEAVTTNNQAIGSFRAADNKPIPGLSGLGVILLSLSMGLLAWRRRLAQL
ncbi:DUF11 domain-containing protein [Halopseudomonas salegens]|uniref:Uncharacterized protein n=1 Tax=Halopseudomonas salegens TaxID=1434072 RepID=A0A1H2ENJ7_9GAMM|nr:DUF11 domain-containing protein [Halopseudomonas salegens]SDT96690.1 hypothetical protein SAMN05216210_0899 [Halopseudomonas salegens]